MLRFRIKTRIRRDQIAMKIDKQAFRFKFNEGWGGGFVVACNMHQAGHVNTDIYARIDRSDITDLLNKSRIIANPYRDELNKHWHLI